MGQSFEIWLRLLQNPFSVHDLFCSDLQDHFRA